MVRTRTTGQDGLSPVPPVGASRGRGHGRGHGIGRGAARTAARAMPADPPAASVQDQVTGVDVPEGPAQAPVVPMVIPSHQETLAQILNVCTSLAQAVAVSTKATTFQVGGGTQTTAARTPEQVVQRL
uniref:Uncharacterized protein LOC104244643 n=1 Tax=Nicotiana sylvestris TaxID=4096 RepID=A0A1U7Y2P8_NICSY|nr:PREDICTED: uncharacterized protein LOC104244643 [Nicotiana sylvestris]